MIDPRLSVEQQAGLQARWGCGDIFVRCNSGVAFTEFAILLPILLFSFLATVDLGLALYQRMTIDHVLRAGAASAMADQGVNGVLAVLEASASESFSSDKDLVISLPLRYFACREAPDASVNATATCAGGNPTSIFYRLSAAMPYDGLFLPITIGRFKLLRFELGSTTKVQVR